MSLNQSRADQNESQYWKPGGGNRSTSSGQQRAFSGNTGGGGSPATTAPSPLSGQKPSLATNRSFKKSNNGQGGHPRQGLGPVNVPESNTATIPRSVQNGIYSQPILQGAANDHAPPPTVSARQIDTPAQKSYRPAPRSPAPQPSPVTSNAALPTTPMKGAAPRGFQLQFGTIIPGFMNGRQIPARTSSAPPNLDEQKRDQAQQDSVRAVSAAANPSNLKPDLPKKDVSSVDQATVLTEPDSKAKKESQVISVLPPTPSQKPSVPSTAGIPMPMHFHQQSSMQFGGPNLQIPSQSMQGTSLPALQMTNVPQVQHPMYITGFQHHLVQPQGIIHQGQNLGFNPQMGPQLPHQLGNLGMNMSPPYNQPAGKFTSARKAVKITHPETHEELRLDRRTDVYADSGPPALRPNPNLAQQTHAVPTYPPAPPIGYFTNSYTSGPSFTGGPTFQSANTLPLTSTPLSSSTQTLRYNYSSSQAQQNVSFMNSSATNSFSTSKSGNSAHRPAESISALHVRDILDAVSSAQATLLPVAIKPAAVSTGERVTNLIGIEKGDSPKLVKLSASSHVRKDSEMTQDNNSTEPKPKKLSAFGDLTSTMPGVLSSISNNAVGEPASASSNVIESKAEPTLICDSFLKNEKPGIKEHPEQSHQVDGESNTSSSNQGVDIGDASNIGESVSAGAEKTWSHTTVSDGESLLDSVSRDSVTLHRTTVREAGSSAEDDSEELVHVKSDYNDSTDIPPLGSVKTAEVIGKTNKDADRSEPSGVETHDSVMKPTACHSEVEITLDTSGSDRVPPDVADGGYTSILHSSFNRNDSMNGETATKTGALDSETDPIPANAAHENLKHEIEAVESARPPSSSDHVSTSSGASIEPSRPKTTLPRGKKEQREALQKAVAAGTTLDLYIAYKCPEEKKEASVSSETIESISNSDLELLPSETGDVDSSMNQKCEPREAELDDWEVVADIPTPRLESTGDSGHKAALSKKYTRDFLLTFSEQCSDLPNGFDIPSDVAEIFIGSNASVSDRGNPSVGKIVDRQTVGPRLDRRGSGMMDADRWNKAPGPFPSPRDLGPDLAYGGNIMGFRPGHGGNSGVLRNPRAQAPIQYTGTILYGPVQSLGPQGGMQRNIPDSDRWQRSTNFQKGLMPPPQSPSQVMHKAEKKYEIGKVTDEEQAKQRKLKAILNKLTPQNFEKLFVQVKEVNIDNAVTLAGVISQIFDKALMEPTFCEMYANFCYHLASELPDLSVDEEKITFKRLLLNKCQEEFERGEREEQEANAADGEGESKQSDGEREEKRLKARRRMLGNIRLIGELYKKKMLTERIMHECIKKLLGQYQNPDEEDIEALCKLMSTIGEMIDHARAKEHMDAYFDIMAKLSNNMKLSSRVRFMLKDAVDLRKNKWQQRRKVEGPKKIEEVHRDAAQERQAQTSRLNRGPSMNSSMRRGQPVDFSPRGFSVLPSPGGQVGGFRGSPSQVRGYGVQDTRFEERNAVEKRTLSIPLPQRSFGDDSITLGPQGGLARGMSIRGQPSVPSLHASDVSSGLGDSRRTTDGLNCYSSLSERAPLNSREEPNTRYPLERFGGSNAFDQPSNQEVRQGYSNRDQKEPDITYDRPVPALSLPSQAMPPLRNASSENIWPEERLRDKSIAAIKEFYSAKDEKEVALRIRDLNAPKFYPSVISIWVNDSFERRDKERGLLAKLIVNLTKPEDGVFTPAELIEGFESVLASLEDTVNDAPKAAEFLGQIFAKVIVEKVVPIGDLGRLIYEGGEEPGRLLEIGLAGDVLGSTLEVIRSDKGEGALDEIIGSSTLQLEDFRPPDPLKSRKLEMFVK